MKYLKEPSVVVYEKQEGPDDCRIKNIIKDPSQIRNPEIGILGIPFDKAIVDGGGRRGARAGPCAIREQMIRYGAAFDVDSGTDFSRLKIVDLGDVDVEDDTKETHKRVTCIIDRLFQSYYWNVFPRLEKDFTLVVLGGGHDSSYATVKGLAARSFPKVGGINFDAHLDVRLPKDGRIITSGTPFRRLIDEGVLNKDNFFEFGMHGICNSRAHYDYLERHGVKVFTLNRLRKNGAAHLKYAFDKISAYGSVTFVSIDIDVVAQCWAPGSSAPSPEGLTPEEIKYVAFKAGENPKVKLFEIMEVNPTFDYDGRTSRLAVDILASFFCGFTKRSKP